MVLTGPQILKEVASGRIVVQPFDPAKLGPNSLDIHLGTVLRKYSGARPLDPDNLPQLVTVQLDGSGCWVLEPGVLYLGVTAEWTETYGFVPYLDGRSSLGRIGVSCHVTAGRGDDGFCGPWTVEITCVEPVKIRPGGRYFQITYHTLLGERSPYKGRYSGALEPLGCKGFEVK